VVREPAASYGGSGWLCGHPDDYDCEYCVDLVQLRAFLRPTQPGVVEVLALDEDGPTRRKFLARLQGEITKRGTIDVLRHGVKDGPHHVDLFYGTPSPGNAVAPSATRRTASRSRGSCATAATRRGAHWTWASSLTAYVTTFRVEEQPHQADGR